MSDTRNVYTAEEFERIAGLAYDSDAHYGLLAAAAQARVIEKLKAEFDRRGYYNFDDEGAHTTLDRLLREEGLA